MCRGQFVRMAVDTSKPIRTRAWLALTLAVSGAACVGIVDEPATDRRGSTAPEAPAYAPAVGGLRRMLPTEYARTIRDILGPEIVIATRIPSPQRLEGLIEVGASIENASRRATETFDDASYEIAEQAMAPGPVRDRLVTCTPSGVVDDTCAATFVSSFGRRAFRRPLTSSEVQTLVTLAHDSATVVGDFYGGLVYPMAAILQSPFFVYRPELGTADAASPGLFAYDGFEIATRMSYFLWSSAPDEALLAAAESGALATDEGIAEQADRMLADDRAREGVRAFFSDMLRLSALDTLTKDPTVFVLFSTEVGASAREETLRTIENLVLDERGDYRDLFTTRTTFIDRKLASIYDVTAPTLTGFARFELPADGPRRGILGQVAFLAPNSHPASSSAVLRGKYVREVFLCGEIPAPPANANTAIPEPSADARTLRDRVYAHLQVEGCRSCHQLMDPVGLGFENFDGLGRFRTMENGALIDPSGSLNGRWFEDAVGLEGVLATHPDVPPCLVRTMYRYATGHPETQGETRVLTRLSQSFANHGYDVLDLMRAIVLEPGFRQASPPDTVPEVP